MLTLKIIAALPPGQTTWDAGKGAVAGFGARRQKGAAVSYVVKYRTADGRQRWATIGRHGAPWTPDLARAEARRILGEVTTGADPAAAKQEARKAATVAELCDLYLEDVEAGRVLTRRKIAKKPATIIGDKGRIERHIKPLLGSLKVGAVTRANVERFRDGVSEGATAAQIKTGKHGLARVTGGRGTATRALGLLGALFGFAVRQGLRPDNPVTGVERHAYEPRQRRASEAEYKALGEALRNMPKTVWPVAIAATKFLALSGWRRGEALALTWAEVDLDTRTARLAITRSPAFKKILYWLDIGNNADTGQFVLGQPRNRRNQHAKYRLLTVAELYPEILDPKLDGSDTLPSCSSVEALKRQEPFVNQVLANHALALLARLFRHREVSYQGGFVNLATGQMAPIPVTQCERKRKHAARDSVSPARPGGRGRFPQVRSGERSA